MRYAETTSSRPAARARRGAAVTEMAVILPVLLLFVLGIIDFAQIMYAYGAVSEAARVGARYAIVHGAASSAPVGPTANDATVQAEVQAAALALNTANLTVASNWAQGSNEPNCPVTVTATYSCPLTAGKLIGWNSITVSGTTTMIITH